MQRVASTHERRLRVLSSAGGDTTICPPSSGNLWQSLAVSSISGNLGGLREGLFCSSASKSSPPPPTAGTPAAGGRAVLGRVSCSSLDWLAAAAGLVKATLRSSRSPPHTHRRHLAASRRHLAATRRHLAASRRHLARPAARRRRCSLPPASGAVVGSQSRDRCREAHPWKGAGDGNTAASGAVVGRSTREGVLQKG